MFLSLRYLICILYWPEVESRTQSSRPRPRTQKNSRPRTAFPRTDTLEAKDRNARGQGPRTQAQVLSKKKKGLHKNFSGDLQKKKIIIRSFQAISTKTRFPNNFSSAPQNFNNSKNTAVLEPRTGQFSGTWGLEANVKAEDLTFEAKDFKMCSQGLHLWYWLLNKTTNFSLNCHFESQKALSLLSGTWCHWWWRWYYPTPSEGWGCGGTPRRPNSRATPPRSGP